MKLLKTEPAVLIGAVVAIINVLVSYNIVSDTNKAALVAAVTAVVPLIAAWFTRSQVFSNETVERLLARRYDR